MDRFQAISAFAKVVEAGSFARAAERLGVSVSAVSRQVADLEDAEVVVAAASIVPRGTLRLTCSATFGTRHLAPAIAEFGARHPQLRFEVELSERVVDIVEEGLDLAIRIGEIGSQHLVGRKIGITRLICCAAPEYLARRGEPRTPDELAAHACLTYEYAPNRRIWAFCDERGHDRNVAVAGPVHANSGNFLEALAVAGMGIAREPDFIVGPEVRAGRLTPILRKFAAPPLGIYVVYPSRRHLSAKVRAFTDFLAARFETPEWQLDDGAPARGKGRAERGDGTENPTGRPVRGTKGA